MDEIPKQQVSQVVKLARVCKYVWQSIIGIKITGSFYRFQASSAETYIRKIVLDSAKVVVVGVVDALEFKLVFTVDNN
jgi:hypothetical protein